MILPGEIYKLSDLFKKKAEGTFTIHKSPIHGSGIFALRELLPGEDIGLALKPEKPSEGNSGAYRRTFLGLYVNHANEGNARLMRRQDGWHFEATKPIRYDEEILTNYSEYEHLMREEAGQGKIIVL